MLAGRRILTRAVLALIIALFVVAPAAAHPTRTFFEDVGVTCTVFPGEERVVGDLLFVRGEMFVNRIVSEEPLINGTNTVVSNLVLNLATGSGQAYGSISLQPDGIEGTWEGRFKGEITDFRLSGRAFARGTGDLEGLRFVVDVQEIDPSELSINPCEPDPALLATMDSGVILGRHSD